MCRFVETQFEWNIKLPFSCDCLVTAIRSKFKEKFCMVYSSITLATVRNVEYF